LLLLLYNFQSFASPTTGTAKLVQFCINTVRAGVRYICNQIFSA